MKSFKDWIQGLWKKNSTRNMTYSAKQCWTCKASPVVWKDSAKIFTGDFGWHPICDDCFKKLQKHDYKKVCRILGKKHRRDIERTSSKMARK